MAENYQQHLPSKNRTKSITTHYQTDDSAEDSNYEDIPSSGSSAGSDWMKEHCRQQKLCSTRFSKRTRDFAEEPRKNRRNMRKFIAGASDDGTTGILNVVSTVNGGNRLRRRRGRPKSETAHEKTLGKCELSPARHSKPRKAKPRQCHWIECVNISRPGSKYCSDECGAKLATQRIVTILPGRLRDWYSTPCVAELKDREALSEIRITLEKSQKQFEELDNKYQSLEKFIEATSKIPYDIAKDYSDDPTAGQDGLVFCDLCGHSTAIKNYVRHIECCYVKTEKKVVFEALEPVHLPGTQVFCNTFNKQTEQYCIRLAANCPDHSKRQQFSDNVICGAPLSWNDLLDTENICRAPKSKCNWHHNWERMRRAEIGIRKMEVLVKQNDLKSQEQQLSKQISSRGGLINLLLNSTKIASEPCAL